MAMDAVPFDLLRSSLDSLKLRFQAANDPGSPSKAWLVHVHDKGDKKPAIYALADGFDSSCEKPSPSDVAYRHDPAIGRRVPRFRRCVRLNGYQSLKPIGEDAARLLEGLPDAVQTRLWRGLPAGTHFMGNGLSRWVLAVFELANANVFPLRDARWFPIDGEQAKTIFAPESQLPADADWYATLPDFAAASVQALAIIQSWLPDVPKREPEADGVARILAAIAQQQQTPKLKRGGQRKYDPKLKKRIRDAWATGRHKRYSDCDTALKLEPGTTKRVLDTARK